MYMYLRAINHVYLSMTVYIVQYMHHSWSRQGQRNSLFCLRKRASKPTSRDGRVTTFQCRKFCIHN